MNSRRVSARSSGDEGHTDLPGGHRLAKNDAVFDAMGALDELSAALGLLRAATEVRENADWLESIQRDLLEIGSELATEQARLAPDAVRGLEAITSRLEEGRPTAQGFDLPGAGEGSARAHLARAICRRAERDLVRARERHPARVTPAALAYLNRLSGTLFALARKA